MASAGGSCAMADGRFVTTEVAESRVWDLGDDAALLWQSMLPHLDRDGRTTGNPKALKGKVAPHSTWLTEARIEQLLVEFAQHMDFEYYEDGRGKRACQFNGFAEHQHDYKAGGAMYNRERPSRYPDPKDCRPVTASTPLSIASVRPVVKHEEAPF